MYHTQLYISMCSSSLLCLSLCGRAHVSVDAPEATGGRALSPLEVGPQAVMSQSTWVWETNSGLLQEQQMVLTSEPSSQPPSPSFSTWVLGTRPGPLTRLANTLLHGRLLSHLYFVFRDAVS